jgi:hypothetical protein
MTYSLSDFQNKIQAFPRVELIHLPTPIQKLENLSKEFHHHMGEFAIELVSSDGCGCQEIWSYSCIGTVQDL